MDEKIIKIMDISVLIGQTITEVTSSNTEITFKTSEGNEYLMYHDQDCCETVTIDDINGDLQRLIGQPISIAEERISSGLEDDYAESSTWTFYSIANINEFVTIRWYGTSNGYYSEGVSFKKINN